MRCLADFILTSDLCLEKSAGPLTLQWPEGGPSLVISNADADHDIPGAVLSAQLIFHADTLDHIRGFALNTMVESLNTLTYTTNRKFAIKLLKRVIDWTPGIVERAAVIYVEKTEWDEAEPRLDERFIKTAERLLAMQPSAEQQTAMRWYRLGIQAESPEDQFAYLWFALEIAAQAAKGQEKVTSKCPHCKEPLFCEKCGTHPMHRRYQGEAIQQMVARVHAKEADDVFTTLQTIRHTLMHGGRINSVIGALPCTEGQAINKLAFVAWQAISFMFSKPDPTPDQPMTFGYIDNLVRRKLVGEAHVITTMKKGDPNNPQLEDFPAIEFSLERHPS